MREIDKIIVHCSDSEWGDAAAIDGWHREMGFDRIGYHFVITNGRRVSKGTYQAVDDGVIETGRPVEEKGAHCLHFNSRSIGICLIGRWHFSARQLWDALPQLLGKLMAEHGLAPGQVWGHAHFNPFKTCPNIDPAILREIANNGKEMGA